MTQTRATTSHARPDAARHPSPRGRTGSALTPELESELAAIAAGTGCELLQAEWKGGVLRLTLDRPEGPAGEDGVSIGDCEQVSKQTSALLDLLDFGAGRYVLEVSSPGLDRRLYRPRDYARFLGRLARVTFEDPAAAGGRGQRTVVGRMVDFAPEAPTPASAAAEAGSGRLTIEEEPSGKRHVIALDTIRQARLEVELGRSERKKR